MRITKDSFILFKYMNIDEEHHEIALSLDPRRIKVSIDFIKREGIKALKIQDRERIFSNLDFLKECDFVESISIETDDIVDFSGLKYLKKLRIFSCGFLKQKIDFSSFPDLEWLSISYNKNVVGLSECKKLYWLYIENYKKSDLYEIQDLIHLEYLWLTNSAIESLEGIEKMVNLKRIEIDTARKLTSLKGLHENFNKLAHLYIYNAKNLTNYDTIHFLKHLIQLELRRTGEINSISFIDHLPNLKIATIGLKVLDGNMAYLKRLDRAGFIDYPHYTHKLKDFIKQ